MAKDKLQLERSGFSCSRGLPGFAVSTGEGNNCFRKTHLASASGNKLFFPTCRIGVGIKLGAADLLKRLGVKTVCSEIHVIGVVWVKKYCTTSVKRTLSSN